ncbi:DUF5009 domain-containing protein [Undibacterium sp.]|uniref:DUF5009 domain-containing protein n=1 Tax=Undibacterium sp. TaxID=1914977 RepID=UPI00374DE545
MSTLAMHKRAAGRIQPIDVFRGITILVMIFVNELAGVRGIPAWAEHAPADVNAMTFVDVVFPAFLFIVGMSIPFAVGQRLAHGDTPLQLNRHILLRTAGLLIVGLFMVNAEEGYNEQAMPLSIHAWSLLFYAAVVAVWSRYRSPGSVGAIVMKAVGLLGLLALALVYRGGSGETTHGMAVQWWGILGLIGWAYLIACVCYRLAARRTLPLLLMIAACIAYYCLAQYSQFSEHALAGWIFSQPGHAAHSSIVLCGVLTALIFFGKDGSGFKQITHIHQSMLRAVMLIALLVLSAYCLSIPYGISKIRATPAWCLYSSAICICIFMPLYWLLDIQKARGWVSFLQPAASNPLLAYIIPYIVYAAMQWLGLSLPEVFHHGWAGATWCAAYALLVLAVVAVLGRLGLRLQL